MRKTLAFFILAFGAAFAATIVLGASAATPPAKLRYACASSEYGIPGVLHYVASRARCRGRGATFVNFSAGDTTVVCRKERSGPRAKPGPAHRRAPVGLVRLVDDPAKCGTPAGPESRRSLPRDARTHLCAGRRDRSLRWIARTGRCAKTEFHVVLERRAGTPRKASALDDVAATEEDRAVRIGVLRNDRVGSPRRKLRVTSLDTAGATGAVRINGDGTVTYDPSGAFQGLGSGESATDAFGYSASDKVHRTEARVTVTVTGANDRPLAVEDAATATEDAVTPIDLVKSSAPAGTAGKDTDPEGDAPLTIGALDATSAKGAVVSNAGGGTISFDPNGRFEALGAGQSATDTLSYGIVDPGGAASERAAVSVTISGANDSPVLAGIESQAAEVGSGDIKPPATNRVTGEISLSDVDANDGLGGDLMNGATVTITRGLDTTHHDTLRFTPQDGISGSYEAAAGRLELSGAASKASYRKALRSIAFTTDYAAPTSNPDGPPLDRRISFRVDDGQAASNTVTRDIRVYHVNRAPVGVADVAGVGEESAIDIAVLANDSDPDGDPITLDSLDSAGTQGAVAPAAGDKARFTATGRFDRLAAGETVHDSFTYRAVDSAFATSAPTTVDVTVSGVNDAPSIAGVDSSALALDSGAPGAAIVPALTAADPDTPIARATISIASGYNDPDGNDGRDVLALAPGGAPSITGQWDEDAGVLTLRGPATAAEFQQALRSVTYRATGLTADGSRTVQIQVDDGAALDHASNVLSRTVDITNHQPAITAQPALSPAFSPEVDDYVVRCTGVDPVELTVDAPAKTDVAVDGQTAQSGSFTASVALQQNQRFTFTVSRGGHDATYSVRCLPADFPAYTVAVNGTPQTEWYFITPSLFGNAGDYAAVWSRGGAPVWWKKGGSPPLDFKLLENGNVGWFSFWQGSPTTQFNEFRLDGTFVRATNTVAVPTDHHDYQELTNGNRLILSYSPRDHVDVSSYTGKMEDTDAAVYDAEIQELAPDGSLVWSWNSKDHIDFSETGRWWTSTAPQKTGDNRNLYDPVHINSVEVDGDGLVISNRHNDALYRIDKATGAIDWKLGGSLRPESLTIIGDDANAGAHFGGQHDARILADGSLTLHDNRTGLAGVPRALRFTLDTSPEGRTATLVESVTDPEAPGSICCGSSRKLPGGNWVASWGAVPVVTELEPGEPRPFTLEFNGVFSYRANPVLPGRLSVGSLRSGMDAQYPRP
jgi:VCBS repeat-containing protein